MPPALEPPPPSGLSGRLAAIAASSSRRRLSRSSPRGSETAGPGPDFPVSPGRR